jgi:hypothetical protein
VALVVVGTPNPEGVEILARDRQIFGPPNQASTKAAKHHRRQDNFATKHRHQNKTLPIGGETTTLPAEGFEHPIGEVRNHCTKSPGQSHQLDPERGGNQPRF